MVQQCQTRCAHILTKMEGLSLLSSFALAEPDYLLAKLANIRTEIRSQSRILLLDGLVNHRSDQFGMLLEIARGEI